MISQIVGFKDRFLIPYNGLKVTWFDNWHPSLDEVLQSLPEIETCPHELFRLLFKNPGSAPKKIALITEQKTPVAIVPLRRLGRLYYEVSTWMIPGAVFPVKPGYLMRALEALKIEVWVTWRRMGVLPPPSPLVRYLQAVPVHIIRLKDDYEQYWRATGQLKHIRKIRNRCKNFEYVINSPDSAEWIIRNAAEKWREDPAGSNRVLDDWVVSDWILAAKYWENKGRHYTILLLDHGIPIGGATLMVDNNDAVGGLIFRKPEYGRYSIGVRLMDLCTSFAAESGLRSFDLGGNADYKKNWAPQEGELFFLKLCPELLFRAKQVYGWAHWKSEKLINRVRGE